jgi:hypothetical protein
VTGGWRWAFIVTGAVTIVVAFLYWLYLRDRPDQHVNAAELAPHRVARGGRHPARRHGSAARRPGVPRKPQLLGNDVRLARAGDDLVGCQLLRVEWSVVVGGVL